MQMQDNMLADTSIDEQQCRFDARYVEQEGGIVLGEGTYGKVYKARDSQKGDFVALKVMKLDSQEEGVPSTAIREVALLKELNHVNVVKLRDVFCRPGKLVLVFDFLENDLKKHMKAHNGRLTSGTVKTFLYQLFCGIEFCHANRIIHRDLKPQNLLVDATLRLQIADFGLARAFIVPVPKYTHEVVTVWYRPPEILLGSGIYSIPVDIWSVGCIHDEMATGAPTFAGDSEIDMIFKIFKKLGTPTEAVWPGMSQLPNFKPTFPKWPVQGWGNIRNTQEKIGTDGVDLLTQCACYDPRKRISARRGLSHAYFSDIDRSNVL